MKRATVRPSVDVERLSAFDSATISNALERLNFRPRNQGFLSGVARCQFPNLPPMVGYERIRNMNINCNEPRRP
jgi:hypothetical protein